MKLILRRSQKSGMMSSKIIFVLEAKADISPEERGWVDKYKLGKTILYSKKDASETGDGVVGVLLFLAMNITVSVDDLTGGKTLECNHILEMLAVEGQITEAAQTFKQVLDAAAHFGGEEVIEL